MSTLIQTAQLWVNFPSLDFEYADFIDVRLKSNEVQPFGGSAGTVCEIQFIETIGAALDIFLTDSIPVAVGLGTFPQSIVWRGFSQPDMTNQYLDGGRPIIRISCVDLLGCIQAEPDGYPGDDTILSQVQREMVKAGANELYTGSEYLFQINSNLYHDTATSTQVPFVAGAMLPFGAQAEKLPWVEIEVHAGRNSSIKHLDPPTYLPVPQFNYGKVEYKGSVKDALDQLLIACGCYMVQSRGRYVIQDLHIDEFTSSYTVTRNRSQIEQGVFDNYYASPYFYAGATRQNTGRLNSITYIERRRIVDLNYLADSFTWYYLHPTVNILDVFYFGRNTYTYTGSTPYVWDVKVIVQNQQGQYLDSFTGWRDAFTYYDQFGGAKLMEVGDDSVLGQIRIEMPTSFKTNDITVSYTITDVREFGDPPGTGVSDITDGYVVPVTDTETIDIELRQRYAKPRGLDLSVAVQYTTASENLGMNAGEQLKSYISSMPVHVPGSTLIRGNWNCTFDGMSLAEYTAKRIGEALKNGKETLDIMHPGYISPTSRAMIDGVKYFAVSTEFNSLRHQTRVKWKQV